MAYNNELKQLALIAKQRMRNASYANQAHSANFSKTNNYFIKNLSAMKKKSGNMEFITITDKEDLQFLKKVYSLLSSDTEVYNPIGMLIDKEYYDNLTEIEKQQYVFETSERYIKAKEKYYLESKRKIG